MPAKRSLPSSSSKLNRRKFLQAGVAAGVAASLPLAAQTAGAHRAAAHVELFPENGTLLPDDGWHLWIDEKAAWKDDTIFLPEDVKLEALPVNAPTGGWSMLHGAGDKTVTLPATVEQHFWGKYGSRGYTAEEYRYGAEDHVPQNGAYYGVSWWYRSIAIPTAMRGKRIFLHVRGARLRAEVYLNEKLVGYSIMEEQPFECDLTAAANPGGENKLAIRITNPAGRYDWVDGLNFQWGAVKLYRSHGFGGLDRGMTISAHESVRIKDVWVLNNPDAKRITAISVLELPRGERGSWAVAHEVIDPLTGRVLARESSSAINQNGPAVSSLGAKDGGASIQRTQIELRCDAAKLWDLTTPVIYHLRTTVDLGGGKKEVRTTAFSFRWFAPSGLGTDAIFRLNGRRIKLYSSISWGFWGLNGLWPTPELAVKEVTQAKKLGLNCLNFHRNVGKEDVLRAQDRLGLLRYMEPGAGKLAIGAPAASKTTGDSIASPGVVLAKPTNEADKFAQRYMFEKCVRMVRTFRSHPSLIQYTLQNEIGADLKNPATIAVLEAMHKEDPSRSVVLNDGFSPPPRSAAQAWFEPYNNKLHRSDEEKWGGWWNNHQGAGDQWYDEFYKSPTEFTYKGPYKDVLTEFGEMEGCAVPDNHSLMLHQIAGMGGVSYDRADHAEILRGTDAFLDKWGFRKAFPATEMLWLSIGRKCYETWMNYMENARIGDELDFAVISGWESTAIENHSGIVDNLRNFKSDPKFIAGSLMPVRPVAKQRSMCTPLGGSAVFDLYLLNDTTEGVNGRLEFSAVSPSGKLLRLGSFDVPKHVKEQFSYLVKDGFATPALGEEGLWRFKFALSGMPLATQTKEIWVADTKRRQARELKVGVAGITPALRKQLKALPWITVSSFKAGERYDVIVAAGLTGTASAEQEAGETTGLEAPPGTRKPEPGETPLPTQVGALPRSVMDAVSAGTPLLAIPQADTLSDGVAKQLADAGAFTYDSTIGDFRAPWMGNWYFVREHALYAGMPVNQAMGGFYQAKGRQSNGLVVDGAGVEIVVGYSRDHDRRIGAGTFTCSLGKARVVYHRVPELHPVLQQRFLANAIGWLAG